MSDCTCSTSCQVAVIRGDTLEYYFTIDIPNDAISNVIFKSAKAGLLVYLVYSEDEEAWCLRLPSEETEKIRPVITSYDLVVELINGEVITVVHNEYFAVYKKRNNVVEEDTE